MEKFLKIGEQYVHWIALGLGGLYLMLMAFFYVVQPPITVELDKKPYLPGEIDQQIKKGALASIDADLTSKTVWVNPQPGDAVAEMRQAFVAHPPAGPPTVIAKVPVDFNAPTKEPR